MSWRLRLGDEAADAGATAGQPRGSATRHRATLSLTLVVCVGLLALAGLGHGVVPAAGGNDVPVEGTVDLDTNSPDTEFDAGEETTLQVVVTNGGEVTTSGTHPTDVRDRATEARSAEINLTSDDDVPIEVRTGNQSLGTVDSGDTVAETVDIYAVPDADPGTYDLEWTIDYRNVTVVDYEEGVGDALEIEESTVEETRSGTLTLEIADEARFDIEDVSHDVHVGDTGEYTVELTNTGTLDITNVIVTASATEQDIFFGSGGATSDRSVATWEAGETVTLTYAAGATDQALSEAYPVDLSIEYDDPDGETHTRTEQTSLAPSERQAYDVIDVEHNVSIGDDGVVAFTITNEGPRNVTAATVSLSTNDPALTFEDAEAGSGTAETFVGDWAVGENITLTKRVGASDDAAHRSYALDATVAAENTDGESLADRTTVFGIEPDPKQRYTVDHTEHTVAIDDAGILTLELTNQGPLNVTDASVQISTNDGAIAFGSGGAGEAVQFEDVAFEAADGGTPTSEAFIGDWAVNETTTVAFRTGATENALERNYTLDVLVEARDEEDKQLTPRERSIGFQPHAEQSFVLAGDDVDLRVGEDRTITGSITNTGDQPANNVVILYGSDLQNVFPRETQYAVGSLGPGETANFSFRIGISEEAEAGPRLLEFDTRYRNPAGDERLDDANDLTVQVGDQRDAFEISTVDGTFEQGESGLVEVELENTRDERVENVRAKLFTDDPLSSDDDEAFVDALEPGESTTLVFALDVDDGAIPKGYPLSIDVQYDDERGQTQLTGTYRAAVDVTDSDGDGIPLQLILLGGLVAAGGVAVLFRTKLLSLGTRVTERDGVL